LIETEKRNGELPAEWTWTTLEKCADTLDRHRVPVNAAERQKRTAGKPQSELYPYYGATGQVGWIDDYLFDKELVLLGEDGAPFLDPSRDKAYMIRGKSWVNNHAHVLRAKNGITTNSYLLHYLNSFDYHDYVTGTTRLKLNQTRMKKIPIPLAPLAEQHRMVEEIDKQLTRIDAGLAALKRAQANLKRYKAAVLKAACEGRLVLTEAELARAEGRDYEPAPQLLQRILAERRAKWEADQLAKMRARGKEPRDDRWKRKYKEPAPPDTEGLPALPEGWCWASVEQVAAHEPNSITDGPFGSKLKTAHYTDSGPRVIRLQNVGDGEFRDEKAHIGEKRFKTLRKHEVFAGDLVIAALGSTLPRSCIIPEFVGLAIVKADCIRFRPHPDLAVASYLNAALNSEITKKIATRIVHGIGRPRLNQQEIKSLPIPVPSPGEQLRIAAEVERRLSVVQELEAAVETSLKRAERLRQAILKRAFEGRLVPQEPADEPAGVLLARIRAERADGKASKKKGEQLRLRGM